MEIKIKRTIAFLLAVFFLVSLTATAVSATSYIKDYTIELPGDGWDNANVNVYSVWGNGDNGKDHWGWPNEGWMKVGPVFKEGNKFFFKIYLAFSEKSNSNQLAFVCRITRADGSHGVFAKYITA